MLAIGPPATIAGSSRAGAFASAEVPDDGPRSAAANAAVADPRALLIALVPLADFATTLSGALSKLPIAAARARAVGTLSIELRSPRPLRHAMSISA